MKATITSALVAGTLSLCAWAMLGGEAWAQARPEAGRGPAAGVPGIHVQPSEPTRPRQRADETAPSEDAPSANDETPAGPGCQDQGRKLELIV